MTRRAVWIAVGVLLTCTAATAMPVYGVGSQYVGASESKPAAWQSTPASLARWQTLSQGLPRYAMVVAAAVDPADPAVIYAATYEPPGLWRSDDRGRSWVADDEGLGGSPVYALHWDAVRRRWWAGTRDGLYTRRVGMALPRSYTSWEAAGLRACIVYALAEDEKGRLYAGTEEGLFRSAEGTSWEAMRSADGQTRMTILALNVSPDGCTLLAGTAGGGPQLSRDAGANWSSAADPSTEAGKALAQAYVSAVLLDAQRGTAYVSTSERVYRSADGGTTWQVMVGLEGRVHAFATAPDDSMYAALPGKVARSTDVGRNWDSHDAGLRPNDKVLDLAVSPDDQALVYAAAWDGLYRSSDGGQNWGQRSSDLGYPDVNALAWGAGDLLAGTRAGLFLKAPDEAAWEAIPDLQDRPVRSVARSGDGHTLYAGCSGGLFRSADGGQTWSEIESELSAAGIAGLVVDQADPDHLYARVAFGRVHESRNGGRSWIARWEGLGDVRPVTAIHQTDAGLLYVGAEDGLFRWDIARQEWQPLPVPLVAPTIFVVETNASDPGAVFVGATDGLWRSPDGGKSWSRWGKGLEGMTVTALAISPADERIAFVGTSMGLYVTEDRGATWQPAWDGRLATASVRDILFSDDGGIIYVASDQGIWQGVSHGAR